MSRTPGASCLIDVRTISILRAYVGSTNKCLSDQLPRTFLDECTPPACGFDRGKDMVSIIGAAIVVATVIGIVHTYPIFIPHMAIHYNSGFLELCLIGALMYLVFLLTTCITVPVIEYAGHRLTALFGLIFVFIGVLLDSQVFDISVLYISHILLIGVGGGLAYAASMSLPADMFRKKLAVTLMILDISGSLGTILFIWISAAAIDTLGYKWTKFMLAVFILFFTLAVHVYPKTSLMYAAKCDPIAAHGDRTLAVRECVYRTNEQRKMTSNECEDTRHLLCVCVCDLRLYNDKSFLLWTFLMMVATMNFYIPYLTIISFAESVSAPLSAWYITIYCLGSMLTRCVFISNTDYSFTFSRTVFQVCTIVAGILWIVINWAETFGWIMVCCLALGAMEGALCVLCPRVALGTIPMRWLNGAWVTTIVFHAFGMIVMNVFTCVLALQTFQYHIAYITGGVLMIVAALLATLLPKAGDPTMHEPPKGLNSHSHMRGNDYNYSYMRSAYGPSTGRCTTAYQIHGHGHVGHSHSTNGYKCNCPICSTIGCLPECLPGICAPKGSLSCDGSEPPSQQPQPQSGTNNTKNSKDKTNDKSKLPSTTPSKTETKKT